MKANCPSCGAEVIFRSSVSVFSVCDHCQSMIVRKDMDLESLGSMAQLPDDISPLKIGSRGKCRGSAFEVIGRLRVSWSEGGWNEWYLLFDDGNFGWLADAMGFFMVSIEVDGPVKLPPLSILEPGKGVDLQKKKFSVDDIKETSCVGSEGELPFRGISGRKSVSVDLSNNAGEFANIEYPEGEEPRLYIGRYMDFANLELSNLRDLEADIKKVRSSELFKCPSCGGPFSMLTPGLTASVACQYCGSTIDTTHPTLEILSRAEKKMTIKPLIPIGSRGTLFGTQWEVTGFVRRADKTGIYTWDEYLLFNPFRGFRWLTTYNGHWNYVEMMRIRPEPAVSDVTYGGKRFKRFLNGKAKVVYVLGEFYWRVRIGETVDVSDFINPPEILSCESDRTESDWSVGRYIEPEEVAGAFGIKEKMPAKEGVAPNQPSPYGKSARGISFTFLGFVMLLTLLQIYFVVASPDKQVYRGSFTFNSSDTSKSLVSPSFDLPGGPNNLSVEMRSNLQNDWIGAEIDLVNDGTGKSLGFEQGVEYYSGTDSDGSWSEGSRDKSLVLSSVPAGRYHLVIQPAADATKPGERSFTLSLRMGVATWCNYFAALLLIGLYPIFSCGKGRSFETKRWSESDLSPYGTSDDEGE
ncbi:MAG: DUF4178 domain-containing protein [Nitrospiraceae bacterium]|nr:DUF4178 domain-containing protein [Nitrospiraceae bacterium]